MPKYTRGVPLGPERDNTVTTHCVFKYNHDVRENAYNGIAAWKTP